MKKKPKRKPKPIVFAPWALKPRPKGAKKPHDNAEAPLSDRVVSNVELRRLGAWRVPADEEERQGGLPAGLRS